MRTRSRGVDAHRQVPHYALLPVCVLTGGFASHAGGVRPRRERHEEQAATVLRADPFFRVVSAIVDNDTDVKDEVGERQGVV